MAKKKGTKVKKIVFGNRLPQNILPVGERVDEDKNIYISQTVYKEIHRFTRNKTTNESGGMLIGNIIEEFGKINIVIHGFVEAKYCESTPTTLKFTHETWDYVHGEVEKKYEKGQIVGWIHTHPDFGIFLSEYDKFIQQNFFKEEYQIAYVIDPIQQIEGFYFWINGKIERCKGFYIFDKTGEKIEVEEEKTEKKLKKTKKVGAESFVLYSLTGVLAIVILFSAIIYTNLLNRMKILESQQENLVNSANQGIAILQQRISSLEIEVTSLQMQIDEMQGKDIEDNKETIEFNTEENKIDEMESTVVPEKIERASGSVDETLEQENVYE